MLGAEAKGARLLSTPSGHRCPYPIAHVAEKRLQSPGLSFPPDAGSAPAVWSTHWWAWASWNPQV